MPDIDIYTTPFCPYCHRAKRLLTDKDVAFNEIDVMMSPKKRREMRERAYGRDTVPQVFVDGQHLGGSDDLAALDRDGRLDELLGRSGAA